jgi:hypothetical protein
VSGRHARRLDLRNSATLCLTRANRQQNTLHWSTVGVRLLRQGPPGHLGLHGRVPPHVQLRHVGRVQSRHRERVEVGMMSMSDLMDVGAGRGAGLAAPRRQRWRRALPPRYRLRVGLRLLGGADLGAVSRSSGGQRGRRWRRCQRKARAVGLVGKGGGAGRGGTVRAGAVGAARRALAIVTVFRPGKNNQTYFFDSKVHIEKLKG